MPPVRRAAWPLAVVLGLGSACPEPEPPRELGLSATSTSETSGADTDPPADLPAGDGDGDPSTGDDDLGDGDGDPGDGDGEPGPYAAPLYPATQIHSPLTAFVRDNLASIRALAPDARDDLFVKIGASSTVSTSTLHCFADGPVELDVHEPALGPTLDFFLLGDAAGDTPFDRQTLAAEVGRTASWAIEGAPSPLDQELDALAPADPSLALVHYGTNDMQQGLTYASAMPGFFASMSDLLDLLIDQGIVPIVFGISRRLDAPAADLWVGTYNAVSRGLAQARSIPFVDLHYALEPLDGYGISGDGIHLEAFGEGPCILTPAGLEHGYNVRNLIALDGLARARRGLVDGEPSDDAAPVLAGAGDLDAPYLIETLPFASSESTSDATSIEFDVYTGCGSNADESGPERVYRFALEAETAVRAMVLDRAGVDVDVHIVDDSASEAGCIARDDRLIETTLAAGTYYAILDTYVSGGEEQVGAYTFALLACDPGDVDCL